MQLLPLTTSGPASVLVCARGFLRAVGEEAGETPGGAQFALRGAGPRGDAEDHPALQQLQHAGNQLCQRWDHVFFISPSHAGIHVHITFCQRRSCRDSLSCTRPLWK